MTRLYEALRLQISLPEKRRTDRRTLANGACVDKAVQTAKGDGNIWLTKTPHHSHIAPADVGHLPGAGQSVSQSVDRHVDVWLWVSLDASMPFFMSLLMQVVRGIE